MEILRESLATSPLCSWVKRMTPAQVRGEEMASCGAVPRTITIMTRNGASVLTRVSNINIRQRQYSR